MSKHRKKNYKRRYGTTVEAVEALSEKQKNRCAICKKEPARGVLQIDHNHETGKIRGLLCGPCNRGLGIFEDSTYLLKKAIWYLEKHSCH